jgi:hypothetical protein
MYDRWRHQRLAWLTPTLIASPEIRKIIMLWSPSHPILLIPSPPHFSVLQRSGPEATAERASQRSSIPPLPRMRLRKRKRRCHRGTLAERLPPTETRSSNASPPTGCRCMQSPRQTAMTCAALTGDRLDALCTGRRRKSRKTSRLASGVGSVSVLVGSENLLKAPSRRLRVSSRRLFFVVPV